jgi:hypothetical protein
MRLISSVTQQASTCLSSILDRSIERVKNHAKINAPQYSSLRKMEKQDLSSHSGDYEEFCILGYNAL